MEESTSSDEWALGVMDWWEQALNHSQECLTQSSGVIAAQHKTLDSTEKIDREKLTGWKLTWLDWLTEQPKPEIEGGNGLDDESPEWVEGAIKELVEAANPSISFKAIIQKRPGTSAAKTLGQMAGHCEAGWRANETGLNVLRKKLPLVAWGEWLGNWRLAILSGVDKATKEALEQPFPIKRAFFNGFAIGLKRGSLTETGTVPGGTEAMLIVATLVIFSGFVVRLKSIRELHEWLQSILGKQLVGDLKRVEKICQRRKIHFRPPGRPSVISAH